MNGIILGLPHFSHHCHPGIFSGTYEKYYLLRLTGFRINFGVMPVEIGTIATKFSGMT